MVARSFFKVDLLLDVDPFFGLDLDLTLGLFFKDLVNVCLQGRVLLKLLCLLLRIG